jgi:dynein assembly factor 1, axonemal
LLIRLPSLNYLDDSPVFGKDRRLAAAFMKGGPEEERKWVVVLVSLRD